MQRLKGGILLRLAGEQAMSELKKLRQRKLSTEQYVEKYESLLGKSHTVDRDLLYKRLIAGLSPGEWQSVPE